MQKSETRLAAGVCLLAGAAMAMPAMGQWFQDTPTEGPDVQVCGLYSVTQFARSGSLNGLSVATVSYNAGDTNLDWYSDPDPRHPFIAYNLYRLSEERVEQIGVSYIKHGFLATNTGECESYNACNGGFGQELFPDCSDTYGAGLNASGFYLAPRYEVNPWTGKWVFDTSELNTNRSRSGIDKLMIVHDDDLDPGLNPGMTWYAEGYYVAADDVNPMNSASYRPTGTPEYIDRMGNSNDEWRLTSPNTPPTVGFVIQEWGGQESIVGFSDNPQKGVDIDGRCVLSSKAFDNGDGTWNYEYALYNVDLDRQVGTFSVPIPAGVNITNIDFWGVPHYEAFNASLQEEERAIAIDSAPWTWTIEDGNLVFSTTTNPLRWGMMFNFRFTADIAPEDGDIAVGAFRSGDEFITVNKVPSKPSSGCTADLDGVNGVNLDDFSIFIAQFGNSAEDCAGGCTADLDGENGVNLDDFSIFIAQFGNSPEDC